jgi:RHS repeat-associated protein
MTFKYDALNRQVSRAVNGVIGYNFWDGWSLLMRTDASNNFIEAHDIGLGGLAEDDMNGYYFRDGSGSTSHLSGLNGQLDEWYRYDLDGTPLIYAPDGTSRTTSAYDIRHYFTGQQWYSDLGLYDLRNRFYSPDIGRFLQPDPIGFIGDRTNLYRYCRNNPVNRRDPFGLEEIGLGYTDAEKSADGVGYYTGSMGNPWDVGGSPDNESSFGVYGSPEDSWTDRGIVAGGAGPTLDTRIPGGIFYGVYGPSSEPGIGPSRGAIAGGDNDSTGGKQTGFSPPSRPGIPARNPVAATSPLNETQGTLYYDTGWLRKQWLLYRATHQAELANNIRFANMMDRFALGTSIVVSGGAVLELSGPVLVGGPSAVEAWGYSKAAITVTTVYGTAVIGTATLNPAAAEEYLQEPYEVWIYEWIIQGGK